MAVSLDSFSGSLAIPDSAFWVGGSGGTGRIESGERSGNAPCSALLTGASFRWTPGKWISAEHIGHSTFEPEKVSSPETFCPHFGHATLIVAILASITEHGREAESFARAKKIRMRLQTHLNQVGPIPALADPAKIALATSIRTDQIQFTPDECFRHSSLTHRDGFGFLGVYDCGRNCHPLHNSIDYSAVLQSNGSGRQGKPWIHCPLPVHDLRGDQKRIRSRGRQIPPGLQKPRGSPLLHAVPPRFRCQSGPLHGSHHSSRRRESERRISEFGMVITPRPRCR